MTTYRMTNERVMPNLPRQKNAGTWPAFFSVARLISTAALQAFSLELGR
jgi:hypothetical protein